MSFSIPWRLLWAIAFALPACFGAHAYDERAEVDENRRGAIDRVAAVHDISMMVGTAHLMLKQAGIRAARNLLAEMGKAERLGKAWQRGVPEWNAAEAVLMSDVDTTIAARIGDGWEFRSVWSEVTVASLDGEEADVVATHFESEAGREQLAMMDWFLSEMVLFTYVYSNRFQYDLEGAEREQKALQDISVPKIPKKDNELEFSKRNPEAFQFIACSPDNRYCPGVKYAKMVASRVLSGIVSHIDAVMADIEAGVRARRAEAQPYVDGYKQRTTAR
jgi:hypothetical protein